MLDFVKLEDIGVRYGDKIVLTDVNFSVRKGETVALMGASGSGKSTILRLIIGLQKQTGGRIKIAGRYVDDYSQNELSTLRKTMGMVFQYSALFDFLSVKENIAFGLRQHTTFIDKEINAQVQELMNLVDLAGKDEMMPSEISGGMKKRVSLARAIAIHPQILLYDEPTAGLDPIVSRAINRLMLKVQKEIKTTSIVVTHDIESAFMVADRIIMLNEGRVVVDQSMDNIFSVKNKFFQEFIAGWDARRIAESKEVLLREIN